MNETTGEYKAMEEMDCAEFFDSVRELGGVSPLWAKALDMLKILQPNISDDTLKIFCIYFSLLDDGNTCIALDAERLAKKWGGKWRGLVSARRELRGDETEQNPAPHGFEGAVKKWLAAFEGDDLSEILFDAGGGVSFESLDTIDRLFVAAKIDGGQWLFSSKYYCAKVSVEESVKRLFKANERGAADAQKERGEISAYFKRHAGIELNAKQLEAVSRGQNENLIITGGPGTGKTTVICHLLWRLLKSDARYADHNLYLAAPSGKAAERMSQSVRESLERIDADERTENRKIFEKLNNAKPHTIHRLLRYRPSENRFSFSREEPFERNSIFVIDEASMIDIALFRSLLEAVPDGARIFILGDKDQLPSVQAGAVLGELLAKKEGSVVALTESRRFDASSSVGILARRIQEEETPLGDLRFENWAQWKESHSFKRLEVSTDGKTDKNPIFCISLEGGRKAKDVKEIAESWAGAFYAEAAERARALSEKNKADVQKAELDGLWDVSVNAKILCAERQGLRGAESLNKAVSRKIVRSQKIGTPYGGDCFPGALLMVVKNQAALGLYNGDAGVAVKFRDDDFLYLMLQKEARNEGGAEGADARGGIFSVGGHRFYPLHLLPSDALEPSYAMTIHKSQGSGYKNILIFLPETKGHPLLNRQILYTAITRAQGAAYIVSSLAAVNAAREAKIERDTQIEF